MLLHGILSAVIGKTTHRHVKLKNIQPICILMCILTIPEIAHGTRFEYKAVFSAPCVDLMTLSTSIPELTQFTMCTYIKLASSDPWTAFIYQLTTSSINAYEFGVLGDSSSLKIWMFGTQINVIETLNPHTWYEICIMWDGKDGSMGFYLDGTLKVNRKLENNTKLVGGGSVVLGCSHFKELNDSVSVGLVGEMYMFRMWNTAQTSHFQKCKDGNVIKWKMSDWIYTSKVVQQDSSLHCAKEEGEAPTSGTLETTGGGPTTVLEATTKSPSVLPVNSPSLTTGANTMTDGFNTLSVETTNITNVSEFTIGTSRSNTLWTSSMNTNVSNGNDSFSNISTFSTSSITTNINNGSSSWSSTVTSWQTSLTSESHQVTNGIMNCSFNDTSAFQTWQTDLCNTTLCNTTSRDHGSAYEMIINEINKLGCAPAEVAIKNYLLRNNLTFFMKSCRALVFGIDDTTKDICTLISENALFIKQYIKNVNRIDYYCCCHEECSSLNCVISTPVCTTSGETVTKGFQSTTYDNSNQTNGKTVYSGSSEAYTRGSNTTFNSSPITTLNIISNATVDGGLSTTIDGKSSTTIKSEVTLTVNSTFETTHTSEFTSTYPNGSTARGNHDTATTYNSESNTAGGKGSMTTTHRELNGTVNSGTTTINNRLNTTAYNGPTSNNTINSTVTTGSMSTYHSGSETTSRNNNSVTTTSGSNNSSYTTESANFPDDLGNLSDMLNSSSLNASTVNRIVSQLENLLTKEVTPNVTKTLLGVLDSFLNVNETLLGPVSNRLIKIVDQIGLQLTFPGENISLTSQSLALAVSKVNESFFTGTSFDVESSSDLQVSLGSQAPANSDGSILLPASLINDLSSDAKKNASRVQFNYYAKTSFFMDLSLSEKKLVSNVISSSVANLSLNNLSENITVTLKTSKTNRSNGVECVFWDFNKNSGSGGWSSYGCSVYNRTHNETVCKCNHLTSFGILMNVSPNVSLNPKDLLILTFITYIGCGLSAIFLSVTLVTYIAFEKIRRDYPSKILIQLCAALVCLNLTFLLNPWIALYNDIPGLCISVAAFLHYFVLVSITWMGLEAFHMYLSLVKVFNTYVRKYILKFCIIGWGAPAVVVAIILAVNRNLYSLKISGTYPNGSADYFCWVDNTVFWITVVGYFAIIFLLNISMFVVVLIQLCRIKKQKQLGYQRKTTLQDLRSVAGITFLLGITWGLGFFSFGPGRTVIMYLFTIFNSLQGFFIFFFYCVAKENVRKQWRRYLCCGRFRLAENSDWSKTATNKLRKQTSKQGVSSSSSNSIQSTSNTNSTTLLVSNEYSLHPNTNGNVYKEKNGVTFMPRNGEMPLQEFAGRPSIRNGDLQQNSLRRTSNRGSVHFIDQI
ncbi:adhesion G-protein coupled receptor G2 isoform X2 [Hyla sarda]|uniref:adhesion G-protein coupled receptor G2 isoform X2 n=1 Tax=Hyla sarda TaxID=327740 RepID=UPI0024C3DB4A|nr:adhesion G-protein coupled receptor G2 isoform X2 [Hyla sarda]